MISGFESAATALEAASQMYEVTANNLANIDIPGFRRSMVVLQSFEQSLGTTTTTNGTQVSETRNVFEAGPFEFTENPLDLAIEGDGFFVLNGPAGPLYTRNGVFRITATGDVVSQGGLPLQARNGNLSVPPETLNIAVHEDGRITADGTDVGQLEIVRFDDPRALVPVGTSLFSTTALGTPSPSNALVHQGYRERSNVHVVDEMTQMILALRLYEAAQRALRSMDETTQLNTTPQTA